MNSIHKACEQELVEAYSWVEVASLSELESHLQFACPLGSRFLESTLRSPRRGAGTGDTDRCRYAERASRAMRRRQCSPRRRISAFHSRARAARTVP